MNYMVANKNKIAFISKRDGIIHRYISLDKNNFGDCIGEMCRVFTNSGESYDGYFDPYRIKTNDFDGEIRDYVVIWKIKELKDKKYKAYQFEVADNWEVKNRINIKDICAIYCIRYSHPRCAGYISNSFEKILLKNREKYKG